MKKTLALYLATLLVLILFGALGGCASSGGSGDSGDSATDQNTLPNTDQSTDSNEVTPSIDLVINNLETACLPSGTISMALMVSAVDENGDLIDTLDLSDFEIEVNDSRIDTESISFYYVQEEIPEPVSVAILMDYSTSITNVPETQTAMEEAVIDFIELMDADDQAEILKFNNGIQYVQPFTSDQAVLIEAATDMEGVDPGSTYLYDSLYDSIEDAAAQTGRKAVVAITDGEELHEPGLDGDGLTMDDVIQLAQNANIPLFLIGLGSNVDEAVLQEMADETGGYFYQAAANEDLQDIYSNISGLLNEGQYYFEFTAVSNGQATGDLTISVDYNDLSDSVSTTFSDPCSL